MRIRRGVLPRCRSGEHGDCPGSFSDSLGTKWQCQCKCHTSEVINEAEAKKGRLRKELSLMGIEVSETRLMDMWEGLYRLHKAFSALDLSSLRQFEDARVFSLLSAFGRAECLRKFKKGGSL